MDGARDVSGHCVVDIHIDAADAYLVCCRWLSIWGLVDAYGVTVDVSCL